MSSTSSKRTALITGAAGGMGQQIAKTLADQGWNLVLAHRGDAAAGERLIADIGVKQDCAIAHGVDIADEDDVERLYAAAQDGFGGLDAVVHTAGINRASPLAELAMSDFDDIVRTNLRGTFVVNKHAARHVRDGGSIVNVSSTVVRLAPPGLSAYTASKAAVDALTRILSKELAGRDINVNAVAPGPTATEAFLKATPADEQRQLAELAPLKRLGSVDDVAGIVAFLLGPTGRWINGQTVHANGGVI